MVQKAPTQRAAEEWSAPVKPGLYLAYTHRRKVELQPNPVL